LSDPVIPPEPGASARNSYERLKAARIRRGDDEAGAYEKAYGKGADGERLVGNALNIAAGTVGNVTVLHDLTKGRYGNIDHVVVGPAGVAIVDAKAWDAPTSLNDKGLWLGRYPCRKHLAGLARQRERVQEMLRQAGRGDVPVESLLCLVKGAKGLNGEVRWHDGHGIGRINPVASHVIRSGPLSDADVAQVHGLLRGHFRVGGGCHLPSMPPPSVGLPSLAAPPRREAWHATKPLRWTLAALLALTLVAIVAAVFGALVHSVGDAVDSLTPMSRVEFERRLPEARALARQRAGHPLRARRIDETAKAFVARYRSGKRCRVSVTYKKQFADSPTVDSRGCSRQPPRNSRLLSTAFRCGGFPA
jgi:hypothetical protein